MATSRPPASLAETKSIIRLLKQSCSDKQWDIICYWSLSPIFIIGVTVIGGILNSANASQMEQINDIVVYFPNHNVTNHNTSSCISQAPSQYQVAWNPFNLVSICDYYNAMNVTQIDFLKACTLACNSTQIFKNEFILLAFVLSGDALLVTIALLTLQSVIFRKQIALAMRMDTIPFLEHFITTHFGPLNQLLPAKKMTDTKIGDILSAAKRRLWQIKSMESIAPLTVVSEHKETKVDDCFNDSDDDIKSDDSNNPDKDNNLDLDSDSDDDKVKTSFSFSSLSSLLCFSCFRHKKNPLSVRLLPVNSTHLTLSS